MAITTKELSTQLEEVTARLRAIESSQHVMTSSPGLPLDKWNDHGFVHRHEIKPLVRAINNGGGSAGGLEERVEYLESGQAVLTSVTNQQAYEIDVLESGQAVLTSALRNKQDTLIPGTGIDITENVISATNGGGSDILQLFAQVSSTLDSANAVKLHESGDYAYFGFRRSGYFTVPANTTYAFDTNVNYPAGYSVTNGNNFILLLNIPAFKSYSGSDKSYNIGTGHDYLNLTGIEIEYTAIEYSKDSYKATLLAGVKNTTSSNIAVSVLWTLVFAIRTPS